MKKSLDQLANEATQKIKREAHTLDLNELREAFHAGVCANDATDLLSAFRGDSLAVARFGEGLIVLRKHTAGTIADIPTEELDDWRMYYERLGLDCMEHAGLLERELARRSPSVDSRALINALKQP